MYVDKREKQPTAAFVFETYNCEGYRSETVCLRFRMHEVS